MNSHAHDDKQTWPRLNMHTHAQDLERVSAHVWSMRATRPDHARWQEHGHGSEHVMGATMGASVNEDNTAMDATRTWANIGMGTNKAMIMNMAWPWTRTSACTCT